MMNRPISDSALFDADYLQYCYLEPSHFQRWLMYLDASYSNMGDYKSVVIVMKTNRNDYYLENVYCRKGSLKLCLRWIYEQVIRLRGLGIIPIIKFEAVFNQNYILSNEFRQLETEVGEYINAIPDLRKKAPKTLTIESLLPFWLRRSIWINENIMNEPDLLEALNQLFSWDLENTKTADDFPDALSNAIQLLPLNHLTNRKINVDFIDPPNQSIYSQNGGYEDWPDFIKEDLFPGFKAQ